jgi:hypothetical protein
MENLVLSFAAAFASGTIPINPIAIAKVVLAKSDLFFIAGLLCGDRSGLLLRIDW